MADLTAGGTGAAGLGTRPARYALVAVWALGLINGLITGWVQHPVILIAYVLTLIGCVVLTGRGDDILPPARASSVVAAAVIAGGLTLVSHPLATESWPVTFSFYLLALLIARGNVRAAAVGAALLLVGAVPVAVRLHPTDPRDIAAALLVPVLALIAGVVWRVVLRQIVTREGAHRSRAARAARDIRIARETAERYRTELAEIREQAGPLLRAIADGEPLDPARRHQLAITEAAIRDRIRSPGLTHPELTAAITERRRAGVRVLLLGDTDDAAETGEIRRTVGDDLAAGVGSLIGSVTEGSITIRAIPQGRGGAVSVLMSGRQRTERVLMSADGTILDRR